MSPATATLPNQRGYSPDAKLHDAVPIMEITDLDAFLASCQDAAVGMQEQSQYLKPGSAIAPPVNLSYSMGLHAVYMATLVKMVKDLQPVAKSPPADEPKPQAPAPTPAKSK